MTEVKPATDEYVAAYKADIAREGECSCASYGECASHCCESVLSLIARIEADRAKIARLKADLAHHAQYDSACSEGHQAIRYVHEGALGCPACRLKAEVKRLDLTVCRACSPSVHTSNACLACHGTGRAR